MKIVFTLIFGLAFLDLMAQNTFPDTGNVGVGTIKPLAKFQVENGDILVRNLLNEDNASSIMIAHSINNLGHTTFGTSLRTKVESGGYNSYGLQFFTQDSYLTGQTEKLRISASGNVGIGTETIDNAQGWNKVLQLHGNQHAKLLVTDGGGVKVGMFAHDGKSAKIGSESQHDLTFTAGYWNDVMTLRTNGNVGIGTANPLAKFQVENGDILVRNLLNEDNASSIMIAHSINNQGHTTFGTSLRTKVESGGYNSYGLQFFTQDSYLTGQTEKLRISASGNVGIGTETIDNAQGWNKVLQLHGNQHAKLLVTDGGGVKVGMFAHDGKSAKIGSESQHDLTFTAGYWNDVMTLKTNGNVSIGTTAADEKLTVNGKIHATEIKVDLNVPAPDYVFERDYELPKLKDIESYIAKHKHLPEMPSAKEMEKNGIDLSNMNMLLLKKVEELTLHLIEKERKIDDQEAVLKEVLDKLNKQQKKIDEQQTEINKLAKLKQVKN